jgi:hypothetical protein
MPITSNLRGPRTINLGHDDPGFPGHRRDGLSQEERAALRLIAATSQYAETAFRAVFLLPSLSSTTFSRGSH